jgi:hypothetical protein
MARCNITNDEGEFLGWFNDESCKASFEEDTRFDGHNQISKATGSQWVHETLYQTAKGAWVIKNSSAWRTKYTQVSNTEAATWLMINEYENSDAIPQEIKEIMSSHEL